MKVRGRERAGERNLMEGGAIYPVGVVHRDLLWSLREPSTAAKREKSMHFSKKVLYHVIGSVTASLYLCGLLYASRFPSCLQDLDHFP